VIVPIAAQYLPLEGVGDLLQSLDEMLMRRKLSILGTLITQNDLRTSLSKSCEEMIRSEADFRAETLRHENTHQHQARRSPRASRPDLQLPAAHLGLGARNPTVQRLGGGSSRTSPDVRWQTRRGLDTEGG
jgi:hypothetical protein